MVGRLYNKAKKERELYALREGARALQDRYAFEQKIREAMFVRIGNARARLSAHRMSMRLECDHCVPLFIGSSPVIYGLEWPPFIVLVTVLYRPRVSNRPALGQSICRSDDRVGINSVMPIEIAKCSGLAEMFDAKAAETMAFNRTEPRQCRWMPIQYCDKATV